MEPPPSLRRARDLLAQHSSRDLPDLAAVSKPAPDSGRRADPLYGALLEAAFLVASADGELAKEEVGELADLIAGMTDQQVSPVELADSIQAYGAQLEKRGRGPMIEALAASCPDPKVRRQVLNFAVLVALCDGELAPSELFVVHSIAKAFEIPTAEVTTQLKSLRSELGGEG